MPPYLSYDDYTVAWIAIRPIEVKAALGMLDRRHDGEFEPMPGSDCCYFGGEVNGHNVVVVTWSAGESYGVANAAALASQVKSRFSKIWFALLVGVAVGLPNLSPGTDRDIRLGDVLVCTPDKNSTGIVQHDSGAAEEGGFEPFQRQAETPAIVRSAIERMRQKHRKPYKRGNLLATYVSRLQDNAKKRQFERPNENTDRLFGPSDDGGRASEAVIERPSRDEAELTRVWHGCIGSGNSLVYGPRRCEELRDQHNLIGLETEAAGVMNVLPTGVVRGVCDYGDGRNTTEWQAYAAAVAASYARGILYMIKPAIKSLRNGQSRAATEVPPPQSAQVDPVMLPRVTNNFSGTFSSSRDMYVGSTVHSDGYLPRADVGNAYR